MKCDRVEPAVPVPVDRRDRELRIFRAGVELGHVELLAVAALRAARRRAPCNRDARERAESSPAAGTEIAIVICAIQPAVPQQRAIVGVRVRAAGEGADLGIAGTAGARTGRPWSTVIEEIVLVEVALSARGRASVVLGRIALRFGQRLAASAWKRAIERRDGGGFGRPLIAEIESRRCCAQS